MDTASLALSGSALTLTLGRTGSLVDVVSNALTLPAGGGIIRVQPWNATDYLRDRPHRHAEQPSVFVLHRSAREHRQRRPRPRVLGGQLVLDKNRRGDNRTYAGPILCARDGGQCLRAGHQTSIIARRPTTDTPSMQDADWFHLPRGALLLEATTACGHLPLGNRCDYRGGGLFLPHVRPVAWRHGGVDPCQPELHRHDQNGSHAGLPVHGLHRTRHSWRPARNERRWR